MEDAATFDNIPNECLIKILSKLSLPELMRLRRVSSRWNAVFALICERKRSLKILVDIGPYVDTLESYGLEHREDLRLKPPGDDDDLLVSKHCQQSAFVVPFLAAYFPNISQLVLQLHLDTPLQPTTVAELLSTDGWPHLKQLTIFWILRPVAVEATRGFPNDFVISELFFATIDRMQLLTHFEFFFVYDQGCCVPGVHHPNTALNSVMSRLEHFAFYYPLETTLQSTLNRLTDQLHSLDLRLPNGDWMETILNWPIARIGQLNVIRRLRLVDVPRHTAQWVLRNLSTLEELELRFGYHFRFSSEPMLDSSLFKDLSHLRQLTTLKLHNVIINNFDSEMITVDLASGLLRPFDSLTHLQISHLRPRLALLEQYNGRQLCTALSAVCLNLETLSICYSLQDEFSQLFIANIRQHLHLFSRLCKSDIFVKQSLPPGQKVFGRHRVQ